MSIPAQKQERFHYLDGLRGIAASLIVIHHAFTANIVRYIDHWGVPSLGYFFAYFTQSGVDLFFVLSGVVLLRPYLRKQKKFRVGDYFLRRVKRIYPPYFFALIFAAFVIWVNTKYPTWYNQKGMKIQFSWLETIKEMAIINFDGVYYNLAWWSLGIEMLFYMFVPLIILFFPAQHKINNRSLAAIIILTLLGSLYLQYFFTDHFWYLYSLTYNLSAIGKFIEYPVCFLMGVFLAVKDFKPVHAYLFIFSGIVLIGCSWVYIPGTSLHYTQLIHPGYGLVYAGVIILAFSFNALKHILDTPLMIWLGERSYSLFLVHFSVFYFVDSMVSHFVSERNVYYGVLTRGIGISLALLAAMLLFYFVERKQARGLVTGNMFWPWQVKALKGGIGEPEVQLNNIQKA